MDSQSSTIHCLYDVIKLLLKLEFSNETQDFIELLYFPPKYHFLSTLAHSLSHSFARIQVVHHQPPPLPLSAIRISRLVPTRTRKSAPLVIINLRQVPRPFLGRCAKGEAQGKRAQSYPRAISTLPVAEYQIAFPILVKHMLRTPHCPIAHHNQSSLGDSLAYVFPSIMISLHISPCIII